MIEAFNPSIHMKRRVRINDPGWGYTNSTGLIVGYEVDMNIDVIHGREGSFTHQVGPPKYAIEVLYDDATTLNQPFGFARKHDPYWLTLIDEPTFEPQPETKSMNLSTAVLLMNDKCRVIEATYMPDAEGEQRDAEGKPRAKRELFKTFDETVKVGDVLIVPSSTRHKITTVKVTDVDVDWDPDTSTDIKWIIGTVDLAHFEELKALDEKMFKVIKDAEKTDKRNKLREKLTAHMDETQKTELLAMTDAVALTHEPVPPADKNEPSS